MLSIPPVTTRSDRPNCICCAPKAVAFMPEAHTLFTVTASVSYGMPANTAACRAGAWPTPAESTLPIYTSSMCAGSVPAAVQAARMASAPSRVAERVESRPISPPMGVLLADTMNTSFMVCLFCFFIPFGIFWGKKNQAFISSSMMRCARSKAANSRSGVSDILPSITPPSMRVMMV